MHDGPPSSAKTRSLDRDRRAAHFVLGLLGMGLVGLALGATINVGLMSHSREPFGLIGDYISLFYALPVALVAMGIVTAATGRRVYLAYPFVAFVVAQPIFYADFTRWLAGWVPIVAPQGRPDWVVCMVAVALSYMACYAVERPSTWLLESEEASSPTLAWTAFIPTVAVLAVAAFAGSPLLHAQQRSRAAIHVPDSGALLGEPDTEYAVHARGTSAANADNRDEVTTYPLEKWWERDARTACGALARGRSSSAVVAYAYKRTANGVPYGDAVIDAMGSNPPTPEAAYHEYLACFVVGYRRYVLRRDDLGGGRHLRTYPTGAIVDAVASGGAYWPACTAQERPGVVLAYDRGERPKYASGPEYCSAGEVRRNEALQKLASSVS